MEFDLTREQQVALEFYYGKTSKSTIFSESGLSLDEFNRLASLCTDVGIKWDCAKYHISYERPEGTKLFIKDENDVLRSLFDSLDSSMTLEEFSELFSDKTTEFFKLCVSEHSTSISIRETSSRCFSELFDGIMRGSLLSAFGLDELPTNGTRIECELGDYVGEIFRGFGGAITFKVKYKKK